MLLPISQLTYLCPLPTQGRINPYIGAVTHTLGNQEIHTRNPVNYQKYVMDEHGEVEEVIVMCDYFNPLIK